MDNISARISHLIDAKNYIDNNINNTNINREQVKQLLGLIKQIDQKIVMLLLSDDFRAEVAPPPEEL